MKYPKKVYQKNQQKTLPIKNMVSFKPIKLFQDVASDMGLIQINQKHRFERSFGILTADDICYTIIDFEDGINLGLVSEISFGIFDKIGKRQH
jgi:dGTPase